MKKLLLSGPLLVLILGAQPADDRLTPNSLLECDGLIEPYKVVYLSGAVDGLLDTVTVDRGDVVKKGQVLATIESTVEKATLELATAREELLAAIRSSQSRLDLSARKLEKSKELFARGFLSIQDLDDTLTEKVLADAGLLQANENRSIAHLEKEQASASYLQKTIRSPIDGLVVERYLSPGELLSRMSQLKIMKLAQVSPLRVEAILPVKDFDLIKVGMKAEIRPEQPLNDVYTAEVKVVDRVMDAASGTFGVRLDLPNDDASIRGGLRCKVRFLK